MTLDNVPLFARRRRCVFFNLWQEALRAKLAAAAEDRERERTGATEAPRTALDRFAPKAKRARLG